MSAAQTRIENARGWLHDCVDRALLVEPHETDQDRYDRAQARDQAVQWATILRGLTL